MTNEFELYDSGMRRDFGTGSLRDTDKGKPRLDFLSPYALERFGHHMAKGAIKYGEFNWERGQPVTQFIASLERHLNAFKRGLRDEDHLAAVMYGVQAIMHFEELAKLGDYIALEMLDRYASKLLADDLRYEAEAMLEADFQAGKFVELDTDVSVKLYPDYEDYTGYEDDSYVGYNPAIWGDDEPCDCGEGIYCPEYQARLKDFVESQLDPYHNFVGHQIKLVRDITWGEYYDYEPDDSVLIKAGSIFKVTEYHEYDDSMYFQLADVTTNNIGYSYVRPEWVEPNYVAEDEVVASKDITESMLYKIYLGDKIVIPKGLRGKVYGVYNILSLPILVKFDGNLRNQTGWYVEPEWIEFAPKM